MNEPEPGADAGIDALVRQAAAFPTDDDRLNRAVQRRIRTGAAPDRAGRRAAWTWLPKGLRNADPSGFWQTGLPGLALGVLLGVTPVVVARVPLGPGDPDLALLSALAMGEPLIGPGPSLVEGL
jgi:hypothetical protein